MSQVELTTLGKSCEFFNGKAHEKSIDENGKYIVVNSKFISSEGKSFKRTNEQLFPLYKGDIVMVMSDVPNGRALAKCFIIDKDDTYSLNQRICCIRSKEFETKYLYYQLNRHEHFLAFNNGENQTNLRKDDILACPLIKPSMEEQRRMVVELDEAFRSLSKAISNTERNYNNSQDIFKSCLEKIFTENKSNWNENKLKEIGLTQTGTTPKTTEKENYGNYIPFIKPADVDFSGIGDIRYENEGLSEIGLKKGRKMESGSILMVCIGATISKVGFATQTVSSNQQINSLTVKKGYFPKFFYYAMTSNDFQNKVLSEGKGAQATLPIINKTKWENLTLHYPADYNEQKEIVEKLDKLLEETELLKTKYSSKVEKLEELKTGILKRAFENELIEAE